MNDIKLSEKIDSSSLADLKKTSFLAKQLLAISRWPVFLGGGCVWFFLVVIPIYFVTNVAILKIFLGVGCIVFLISIIGLQRTRQQFMLGSGFALGKRKTSVQKSKQFGWLVSILSVLGIVIVVVGSGMLVKMKVFPLCLVLYFETAVLILFCVWWTIYCFYTAVSLKLWEFILLGIPTIGVLCNIQLATSTTEVSLEVTLVVGWFTFFATAMIVIGLSFMRRWFVWRNSVKTLEGRESE